MSKAPEDRKLDPEAPASELETHAAAELREALADPSRSNADADFARSLALAHAPRELAPEEHRAILARALARPHRSTTLRLRVVRIAFGAGAAAMALAAGLVLVVRGSESGAPPLSVDAFACVRSTQPLFREPFPTAGGESERIDRIAMARASDFRDNEFVRWGVRP